MLHRCLGVWLPVTQSRPWEPSPDMHTLLTVLNTILKRSKYFVVLLLATIMGITAITTTVAVVGVALHQMAQTTTFVQEWHKNASSAWGAQTHIDEEINNRLVDVERNLHIAVLLLGAEVQNLKLQMHLKCDENITTFCVTAQEYNQSEQTWENIRRHLQGYMTDNLTLDIKQAKTIGMQHASLRLLPGTDTLQGIAEGLKSLSPLEWTKGIRGGLVKTLHMLCCFTIILCLVSRST